MPARSWNKLGLIAGGRELPREIVSALGDVPAYVVRLKGMAEDAFDDVDSGEFSIGEPGRVIRTLKDAGCDAICFAGYVSRPDFSALRLDARGVKLLPRLIAAGRKGDDALIRVIVEEFEREGFQVIGAQDVLKSLAPEAGLIGPATTVEAHRADIEKAMKVAAVIGGMDIGQGAVVVRGVVLAVEAQEGTNAMLQRVAGLPQPLRGTPQAPEGVLAKRPKPIQERRVDLPVIGVETVRLCAEAGLAGIALEAGGALIIDRPGVLAALGETGLFLCVEPPQAS